LPIFTKLILIVPVELLTIRYFVHVQDAPFSLVTDGPTMTITPFLSLRLRGKKDALLARQRARRVASLLQFSPLEQACIAAGTFVVACQALAMLGKARLYFQIEHNQLHVFAEVVDPDGASARTAKRLVGLFPEIDPKLLYRLTKPLPPQDGIAEELDLAWLVKNIEETASDGLFDEVVKQNQEILAVLHELRLYQNKLKENGEKPASPHAA